MFMPSFNCWTPTGFSPDGKLFYKILVKKVYSHNKCFGSKFSFTFVQKTWWHSWRCLWTYKSNSFDPLPSCIFVSIQPFFSSLECPLAKVKELCGMFQNSFNGFQVLWATSQPAGTPYQLHARCVIGLPVLQLKLFIALLFFLDYTQDFLLYAKKKKNSISLILLFFLKILPHWVFNIYKSKPIHTRV